MKKIGLDLRPLQTGHRERGIGLYAYQLVKHLLELREAQNFHWVFFSLSNLEKLPGEFLDYPNVSVFRIHRWRSFGKLNFIEEQIKFPWDIWRAGVDLVHVLAFDVPDTQPPFFSLVPVVVTLPDLIPRVFPEAFPQSRLLSVQRLILDQAIKKAKKVIAISQSTKKDAIKFLGLKEKQITVIYLGPGQTCEKSSTSFEIGEVKKKCGITGDFILYVGDIDYRKNVKVVIEAFSQLLYSPNFSNFPNLQLVLVGRNFLNESLGEVQEINQFIAKFGLTDKIIKTGFLDSEDLKKLYQRAKLLLFPSLYEGFGLTVLEALSCGCPVVTSNVSSLPEVGGNAVLYADPKNIDENVDKMMEILNWTQDARCKMQEAGFEQVKNFNWQKCAKQTVEIYQEVLHS